MVCFHKRYDIGDKHEYKSENFNSRWNGWDELKSALRTHNPGCLISPLFLMDHSGLSISTIPFGCKWDSGQIGFIFITQNIIIEHFNGDDKKAESCLLAEVSQYDQYLRGDIYGFILRNKPCKECGGPGKNLDSCWGFYGSYPLENGMSDNLKREYVEELKCYQS